jgi:hypothetical protein
VSLAFREDSWRGLYLKEKRVGTFSGLKATGLRLSTRWQKGGCLAQVSDKYQRASSAEIGVYRDRIARPPTGGAITVPDWIEMEARWEKQGEIKACLDRIRRTLSPAVAGMEETTDFVGFLQTPRRRFSCTREEQTAAERCAHRRCRWRSWRDFASTRRFKWRGRWLLLIASVLCAVTERRKKIEIVFERPKTTVGTTDEVVAASLTDPSDVRNATSGLTRPFASDGYSAEWRGRSETPINERERELSFRVVREEEET